MLKKIILILVLFGIPISTFAHPLDISNSTISIKNQEINIVTYFHSFEIDYLLKENGVNINSIDEYFLHNKIIAKYLSENIEITNNDEICKLKSININQDEIYNILTQGLQIDYKLKCDKEIEVINIKIDYFNNFPLQTNKVSIYNLNNSRTLLANKVLTPKINYIKIKDINNYEKNKKKDTDCDGISDEDEKVYKTDPKVVDTDKDNYSDGEEVKKGWNPTDRNLGPGQEYRSKLRNVNCTKKEDEIIITVSNNKNETKKSEEVIYSSKYLNDTLKYITLFFTKNEGNIFYIFFVVYVLGIIHAIGPGHSKSLLVAYTLQNNNGYRKGIIYSLVFTVTHILDILLLFLITTLVFNFIDISKYTYYIQIISVIILMLFSIYLLFKAFKKIKDKNKTEENTEKKTLLIAFLSGLAPCSFAWSIYFLLLSIGKLSMILPLILILGIGILTTLIGIVLVTVFLKNNALNKTRLFSIYANKISSIMIFIVSIILGVGILNT